MSLRVVCISAVLGAALQVSAAAADTDLLDGSGAALATYVAKPDSSYTWHVMARHERRGAEIIELQLTSQTWRGIIWKHQLVLIKPTRVHDPSHGLLIVGGGRWRDSFETEPSELVSGDGADVFVAIARRVKAVVAVLGQVPFQPMFDRREDELIAYTFDQYLKTGDPEWPLLLPMVKSVVRAMDASSAAAAEEWGAPLTTYTLLGGSKRGWTTWLTAPVDRRVTAIAPVVIDALNMRRHFPYQTEAWGKPSDEISPYTDLGLDQVLGSDAGAPLRRIVDPFEYRAAITQPKLVVLATNDHYFPVDAANLYWDSLSGPKYLLYLPNDQHSISDYRRVIPALREMHASVESGKPLPRLEWEYRWAADAVTLCVRSTPAPAKLTVWRAPDADRDFRDAVWEPDPNRGRKGFYTITLPVPSNGYEGVFAEAVYGRGLLPFSLSTNLAILTSPAAREIGPRPAGTPGICDAGALR